MIPWLRDYPFPFLKRTLGWTPFFSGPIYGTSMLAGGIIIAIMILPIITSVSREILRSVPDLQREAAYALGATRWEVTRIAVLSYAKKGFFGAVILGLGRALGETMAVTMVIGNTPQIAASLFAPGLYPGQRDRERIHRGHHRRLSQRAFRVRPGPFRLTILANLDRATALEDVCQRVRPRAPCNDLTHEQSPLAQVQERAGVRDLVCVPPCSWSRPARPVFFHLVRKGPRSGRTGIFSPSCPNPSARPAAAWPTPSSAPSSCWALARLIGIPVGVLGGVYLSEYGTPGQLVASLRRRRAQRRPLDHLGYGRLRPGCFAIQSFSAFAGGIALGTDDDSADHAHDRGSAAPGS